MENTFNTIRREYGSEGLSEKDISPDPFIQFQHWFDEAVASEKDPTAMHVATVDAHGCPDIRVVLLKALDAGHFVFYTHYASAKGQEIAYNPHVALNFFWATRMRQVRVRGIAEKVAPEISDAYFASRPLLSQKTAMVSQQSQVIRDREVLEANIQTLHEPITRPVNWGGYAVSPIEIEFWQGRDNRFHDRLRYRKNDDGDWFFERLAP